MNKKLRSQSVFILTLFLLAFLNNGIKLSLSAEEAPLRIHFLNVGYGDAILIDGPGQFKMLIDAGGPENSKTIGEYLNQLNVTHIDNVIITHPHSNHFGGLFDLLDHMSIKQVAINGDNRAEEGYFDLLTKMYKQNVAVNISRRGNILQNIPSQLTLEILHPDDLSNSVNGNSIVLFLQYKDISMVFLGDIDPQQQKELIELFPRLKTVDLIKLPHHGGPLDNTFIKDMQDKIYVISTGDNPWGLPDNEVLSQLQGSILRTDKQGNVVIESDGITLEVLP